MTTHTKHTRACWSCCCDGPCEKGHEKKGIRAKEPVAEHGQIEPGQGEVEVDDEEDAKLLQQRSNARQEHHRLAAKL